VSTLKVWELRKQLDDLGDDVEIYVEAPAEGEFEIAEVRANTASGTATIMPGDER